MKYKLESLEDVSEEAINNETIKNFRFFNENSELVLLKDKLFEIVKLGCDIDAFWKSFSNYQLENKDIDLHTEVEIILFRFKELSSIARSMLIIKYLAQYNKP